MSSLKDVHLQSPLVVKSGSTVTLRCTYDLENESLYTVKWYKGRQEFFRYVPKELPNTKVFPLPGVNVDVSIADEGRACRGIGAASPCRGTLVYTVTEGLP